MLKNNLLAMLAACTLISCGKSSGEGSSVSTESSLASEKRESGGDLDRESSKREIEAKIFDREFGFISTWTNTVEISRCLNDGGWLKKLTGEYHFDIVESVKEFSYFRFNIWKLQELLKDGGVNESNDIDVEMHFEIPSRVKDVEITGITSINENTKQIEFVGNVFFPNEKITCFEKPIPFSSVIAARKYDDGWRLYQMEHTNHLD